MKKKIEEIKNAELSDRILSAIILIPIVVIAVIAGGTLFNLLALIAACLMSFEWLDLISKDKNLNRKKWLIFGALYIAIPVASLISIRSFDSGIDKILYILFIVWVSDTAAYVGGKYFGGPKLAEKISPNKTISGSLCGLAGAVIIGVISFIAVGNVSFWNFLVFSIFLAAVSQAGDLFESYLKRHFKVKDTSDFIPGHGGVLDRLDALLFAAPIAYVFFAVTG